MPDIYNAIYSTPKVLDQEITAVETLNDQDRTVVATALREAWHAFEATFGDATGFKQATAKIRTRFRLDLLQNLEHLNGRGRTLEARGVRLLVLYLRGVGHARGARRLRMHDCLRDLIRTDPRRHDPDVRPGITVSAGIAVRGASTANAVHS